MPRNILAQRTFTLSDGRQITYTRLKPQKPQRRHLMLSQTKGIRTNTNRGSINTKHATLIQDKHPPTPGTYMPGFFLILIFLQRSDGAVIKTLKSLTYNEPKSRSKYSLIQKFFWRPKCHRDTFIKMASLAQTRDANSISLKRKQLVLQNALRKKGDIKKLPRG